MSRRNLLFYLLLNVLISACVAGAILFWYDRNYRVTTLSSIPPVAPLVSQEVSPAATSNVSVKLVSIVGAGLLDAESVTIKNTGDEPLNLSRWQLKDSDKNVFIFPNLTLNTNGAVQVHTKSGTNNVIDLYWNASVPIWESGEEAQLLDSSGKVQDTYQVP
jgi:hypothetical protein